MTDLVTRRGFWNRIAPVGCCCILRIFHIHVRFMSTKGIVSSQQVSIRDWSAFFLFHLHFVLVKVTAAVTVPYFRLGLCYVRKGIFGVVDKQKHEG